MDDHSPRFGLRNPLAILAALIAVDMAVFMDRAVLSAVLPPVQERFHLNDTTSGLLVSIFTVSYLATLPLVGWLCDRMPRHFLLAAGLGIWSIMSFLTGMAQSFEQMLIARALTGIGEATCAPIAPTLIADCFPRSQRSRALAALFMAIPIGSALGLVVGGQAIVWLDWRWGFFMTGSVGGAAALAMLLIQEPSRGTQDDDVSRTGAGTWKDFAALRHNTTFVWTTIGMALMVFALVGLNAWAPTFLHTQRGITLENAATWLGVLVGVAGLGGAALGGWLGDHLPTRLPTLSGVALLLSVPLLGAALFVEDVPTIFILLGIGLALLFVTIGPLDTVLVNATAPNLRGAAFSLNVLCVHVLGEIPGPIAVGFISDRTSNLFLGVVALLPCLLAAGMIFWSIQKRFE